MANPDADSIKALSAKVVKFRDDRDWKQFHSLKNLATALNVEAAEVLELFQWTDQEQGQSQKVY